jgi:hypothetical protein
VTTADRLLSDLADGLRGRIAERRRAEERLAAFAFREGPGGPGQAAAPGRPRQGASGGHGEPEPGGHGRAGPGGPDWRYFVSRTLADAGEPGTLDLLERLSGGEETVMTLAGAPASGVDDGLATVDRIAGLGAAGLAGRDLETGRVSLTALGSAVLAFALEWERRASEPGPARDPGLA